MSVGKICLLVKYFINMKRKMTALRKKQSHNNHQVIHLWDEFYIRVSLYKVVMQNKINVSNKLKIKKP